MKTSLKALAGLVVLASAIGTGWLILPAAPLTNNPGVSSSPNIAPGVSNNPNPAPGVSTNLPPGVTTNLPPGASTNLPPGVSRKPL
ncbi:MAG TPA: hypothetical protein VGZ93_10905 [Candidatus Methylacidiphilales bacterium]|nr:hypothetical protein [Candidatus Methylacidiphilales bacterium]